MDNPFEKRATEYISDARALLPLVSPEPMEYFYSPQKKALFEKLTMWVGSPGCGKTTIARILEFDSLWALSNRRAKTNNELAIFLASVGALEDGMPTMLAHRIPMTTNFRSIWELPYELGVREALLRAFVQSKAVLGWLRQLERAEINFDDIEIVLRDDSESARTVMKADNVSEFRNFAREIELSVFKIVTALIPPKEESLVNEIKNSRYDIFEEIKGIKVKKWPEDQGHEIILTPMIIIDDAHELHQAQFVHLRDWLKSRVISISRWIMCRLDVVPPEDYRDAITRDAVDDDSLTPGSTLGRDYYVKLMQQLNNQRGSRRFRKVAVDISNRYFSTLPVFAEQSVRNMAQALSTTPPRLGANVSVQLQMEIEKLCKAGRISESRLKILKNRVPITASSEEVLGTLRILLNREINNSPQLDLLPVDPEDEVIEDSDADTPGMVKASLIDGARIQLMHEFKRPFYYGMDKLADASNTNIEQFISLAGPLVDELFTKIVRRKPAEIAPALQHQALQIRARETMAKWDFPYHDNVRFLVDWISRKCLEKTLLPHAPLDDGANAFGVLQEEMDAALKKSERLARVLHFAFAYKALIMIPHYSCKNKRWCLLELGGVPILAAGLTLNRGGFIEGKISDLDTELTLKQNA